MKWIAIRHVLAGLLVLVGTSALAQDGDAAGIDEARQVWIDRYNEGDLAAVAEQYTEDGRFYASTGEVAEGRQAIQDAFQQNVDLMMGQAGGSALQITVEPTETQVFGDVAHEVGTFTVAGEDGQAINSGHYIAILRRVDGTWLIAHQVGTDSLLGQMLQGAEDDGEDASSGEGGG